MTPSARIKNIALFSNYVPIQCGISTFAKNLFESLSQQNYSGEVVVVGVNDGQFIDDFPQEVVFEVSKNKRADYVRAAEYLNTSNIDVVCIQHEYGIFGGEAGDYLLDTVARLKKPIIVTLHTVLDSPSADQRRVMIHLAAKASKLVVMSQKAVQMLQSVYGVSRDKIAMIHHGVPDAFQLRRSLDEQTDLSPRLLTFGLLSPDKGIENVIQAMPKILSKRPDAQYMVVGATHPKIKATYGETYRESLEELAESLGVSENIEFVNRFLSPCEVIEYMDQADIYVTPYLKPQQITSGTLAYAIGSGKAVISTPYWYAEELLADDRGILVPWNNPEAIADAALVVLLDESRRTQIQENARALGKTMSWSSVGARYLKLFDDFRQEPQHAGEILKGVRRIPEFDLSHLRRLTDDTGLLQHAIYTMPRLSEGYCLDDNCRALLLIGLIHESMELPPFDLDDLSSKYLAFVAYALDANARKFRNFLSYSGAWLEDEGSEDSQGRSLWTLAGFATKSKNQSQVTCAIELFQESFGASKHWTSPRAWAYAIMGVAYLQGTRFYHTSLERAAVRLSSQLLDLYDASVRPDWQWFEPCTSYCNARIPQALLTISRFSDNERLRKVGLDTLDWLWNIQAESEGLFEPIGSRCPYFYKKTKPRFDQQPVEVYSTVSACIEAWKVTLDPIWRERAWQAFEWFLGANVLGVPLYDVNTGGCYDGLHENSVNQNQGAESTLSFLMACEEMRSFTKAAFSPREGVRVY